MISSATKIHIFPYICNNSGKSITFAVNMKRLTILLLCLMAMLTTTTAQTTKEPKGIVRFFSRFHFKDGSVKGTLLDWYVNASLGVRF